MAGHVQLRDVRTWYDEHGSGEPLVLLHPGGAGVDARAWDPNLGALAGRFRVYTPERRGHGRTPDVDGPITFEAMAQDTIEFLERVVGGPADLVGCSDGATVALYVAARRPDLVRRMAVVAGPAHRDGWYPEAIDPDLEPPAFLAEAYAELSPDGPDHYPVIVAKLARMHVEGPLLTVAELRAIPQRILVMVADDDEVVLEHAIAMYRELPHAELAVVPGTSHGLLVEKPEFCNRILLDFLCNEPVQTFAPIRRRSSARPPPTQPE